MTEQEWLACADPVAMLGRLMHDRVWEEAEGVRVVATDRKLRLFACACCRQMWDGVACEECLSYGHLPHESGLGRALCDRCRGTGRTSGLTDYPRGRRAVGIAERYADGSATELELTEVYYERGAWGDGHLALAVRWCSTAYAGYTVHEKARNCAQELRAAGQPPAVQADLLRCIFGNSWRPVALCGESLKGKAGGGKLFSDDCSVCVRIRTPTVLSLARAAYEDRDWAVLPILAETLEEAGYTNADMLAHLRGPGPHARGCHAVDLILEKE